MMVKKETINKFFKQRKEKEGEKKYEANKEEDEEEDETTEVSIIRNTFGWSVFTLSFGGKGKST